MHSLFFSFNRCLIKLKLLINILDVYLHSTGQINEEAPIHSLDLDDIQCEILETRKDQCYIKWIGALSNSTSADQ